ncbi:MAG: metal-sensing transcriptional repressor [Spongiibacteraceae bacterium]
MTTQDQQRKKLINRLSRIEGQIRGIKRQIEGGEDCESIAAQFSAVRKASDKAFYQMIACALSHEIEERSPANEDLHEVVSDISGILAKYA